MKVTISKTTYWTVCTTHSPEEFEVPDSLANAPDENIIAYLKENEDLDDSFTDGDDNWSKDDEEYILEGKTTENNK